MSKDRKPSPLERMLTRSKRTYGPAHNPPFDSGKGFKREHQPLRGVRLAFEGEPGPNPKAAPMEHTEAEGYADPFPGDLRWRGVFKFWNSLPESLRGRKDPFEA